MSIYQQSGRSTYMLKYNAGGVVVRSTGTSDRKTALEMDAMVQGIRARREWDLLEPVRKGVLPLPELYDAWKRGSLDELRARLAAQKVYPHLAGWLASSRASEATKARYRLQVETLITEETTTADLTSERISRWLHSENRGSGSTKARYLAALSSFLTYLRGIQVLQHDPLAGVTRPKQSGPRTHFLELPDVLRLVDAAAPPHRLLYALAYGAGAELSAALRITRRDVDMERKVVRLKGSKNAWRDRAGRVAEWAWPIVVEACRDLLPDAPLFTEDKPAWWWSHYHSSLLEKLGLRGRLHDARHHWAVRMLRAGTPAELVARQLGHRDATMVLRVYGRFVPQQEELDRWEERASAQAVSNG